MYKPVPMNGQLTQPMKFLSLQCAHSRISISLAYYGMQRCGSNYIACPEANIAWPNTLFSDVLFQTICLKDSSAVWGYCGLERECRNWDFCSLQISRPYGYKYAQEAGKLGSISIGFRSQTTKTGRGLRSSADPASDAHFPDLGSERFLNSSRSEGLPNSATQR
jgi:hypothetical protein